MGKTTGLGRRRCCAGHHHPGRHIINCWMPYTDALDDDMVSLPQ
jgi:hypothetical protein